MPLYVDGREDAKHKWSDKLRNEGIDAKTGANLPADFLWQSPTGLVLVERKTWQDFVASMQGSGGADAGNRMVGQLVGAIKGASLKVLLLEGPLPAYVRDWNFNQIDDASVSLQWQSGVIIIHSLGWDYTTQRLREFYRYTQKEEHRSLLRPQPPSPEMDVYMNAEFRKKIAAMMCVPRLGEKGALALAQQTESPADAVNLSHDELIKLEGMGKIRAAAWVEFWRKW